MSVEFHKRNSQLLLIYLPRSSSTASREAALLPLLLLLLCLWLLTCCFSIVIFFYSYFSQICLSYWCRRRQRSVLPPRAETHYCDMTLVTPVMTPALSLVSHVTCVLSSHWSVTWPVSWLLIGREWPGYLAPVCREWSRDLVIGLWLVKSDLVIEILALLLATTRLFSHWSDLIIFGLWLADRDNTRDTQTTFYNNQQSWETITLSLSSIYSFGQLTWHAVAYDLLWSSLF